jgi:hypothetical protein
MAAAQVLLASAARIWQRGCNTKKAPNGCMVKDRGAADSSGTISRKNPLNHCEAIVIIDGVRANLTSCHATNAFRLTIIYAKRFGSTEVINTRLKDI